MFSDSLLNSLKLSDSLLNSLKFTMITMSQTPDVGPNPVHFSQNSLPGQCLPEPGQPTAIHTSLHWEFPSCFHLSAHSNSKLSPAHVPFLPGLGPTSLVSLHILLLSTNLFSDCTSIFLNTTCPPPESHSSPAQCPDPSAWPSGGWSQSTFVAPPCHSLQGALSPSGSDSSQVPTDL